MTVKLSDDIGQRRHQRLVQESLFVSAQNGRNLFFEMKELPFFCHFFLMGRNLRVLISRVPADTPGQDFFIDLCKFSVIDLIDDILHQCAAEKVFDILGQNLTDHLKIHGGNGLPDAPGYLVLILLIHLAGNLVQDANHADYIFRQLNVGYLSFLCHNLRHTGLEYP